MQTEQYRLLWNTVSTSKKIRNVSGDKWFRIGCHLVYTWLLPWTDDDGRMRGGVEWIRVNILPNEGLNDKEIEKMLTELFRVELIRWYEVDSERFIEISNHENKQKIRKDRYKPSLLPIPTICQPTDNQLTTNCPQNDNLISLPSPLPLPLPTPIYTTLGKFKNVKLTEEAIREHSITSEEIESLSAYIASKGKKYKNHCATILTWRRKNGDAHKDDWTPEKQSNYEAIKRKYLGDAT